MRVLVLNADFQPLNLVPLSTISWQEAMCHLVKGTATAIAYYDKYVNSATEKHQVPSIIVMRKYKYFKYKAKYSPFNVKLRDNFTCQYCGKVFSEKSLTMDHVIPRAKGGKTGWNNIVAACKECNQGKAHHEWKPLHKPYTPNYMELAKKLVSRLGNIEEDWKIYISFLQEDT